MSQLLRLPGRNALSEFRRNKLLQSLRDLDPTLDAVDAVYWHFVRVRRALSAREVAVLDAVLTYGPAASGDPVAGELLLVVPRLGTISPWSSKATDIAHNCGLDAVERIERGVAYTVRRTGPGRSARPETMRRALAERVHDRMTETVLDSLDDAGRLFERVEPQPLAHVDVLGGGAAALERANRDMGLALSEDEMAYLLDNFRREARNPTDVELMMFAQANSEHCRHKIFNAEFEIDGVAQPLSLFAMIRNTHARAPQGTLVAYSDNAAVMQGARVSRLYPGADGAYRYADELTHALMKVETHNHPTAIAPFPGAATGSGGELRDEAATGRGAKPRAGLTGYSVSNLRIPGFVQPWEQGAAGGCGSPARIASALQIMLEAPIGGASFNNEFGRPNLAGYFRTFELAVDGEMRGYHKPIMIAGGLGSIADAQVHKQALDDGALLVQLGGPGMLIGLGGGAASSMASGANADALDYASVQRGNAEIQRRAQEVIDRCWALGAANPILSIHDVGAGGLSNALPELVHASSRGTRIDLRAIPSEEQGMSPLAVWCNEAQERFVLALRPRDLDLFRALCERERCPFAVIGTATGDGRLRVDDPTLGGRPVDMDLSVLLGKPPRMLRKVRRIVPALPPLAAGGIALDEAALRVLRLPAVAGKTFLISIGDRTVGGLTARDQMVGPWQVPVADVAVALHGFRGYTGEAFAVGERAPLALLDAAASARMAIGEALTNLAAAPVAGLDRVKLSANWMAAAGQPGEDAALYDAVKAVGMDLCPRLGISIPVGKDSLSMSTAWEDNGAGKRVTAPLSLIVSAFAPVTDARRTLTPQLRTDRGDTELILVDLGHGANRLGGSALAQVYAQVGDRGPDVDDPVRLGAFFAAVQALNSAGQILAYHDRSDGGLFATLCEMAFAGHVGVTLNLDPLCYDPQLHDVIGNERAPDPMRGRSFERLLAALFAEELGAVLQVRRQDRDAVLGVLRAAGLGPTACVIGMLNTADEIRIVRDAKTVFGAPRAELLRAWSELSYRMQALRDNPQCAEQEHARTRDAGDPGLGAALTFDPAADIAAPFVNAGVRPRVAVLREQGVNGQIEMAAAFERAGFDAFDVHMTDILSGRVGLSGFKGITACGGFSYGDVLGAGEGWAKSILFNARARDEFEAFFNRADTFGLGVCNGCQMMANLRSIVPGAPHWPRFVRNASEQFEARFVLVEVPASRSVLFEGMAGSRIPIVVSHGEGLAEFADTAQLETALPHVALRFVDHRGAPTEVYPCNPNGSPRGICGLTSADGRFTILMPHPERAYRSVQNSWHPDGWGEDGPWLRLFRNARKWVG